MQALKRNSILVIEAVALLMLVGFTCFAQEPKVLQPTAFRIGDIGVMPLMFTTKPYRDAALELVLAEASRVAADLQLPESLPFSKSNIVKCFINPYGYAQRRNAIGTVTTSNYCYYISQGNKFSYLESPHQDELCRKFQASHTLPVAQINTNEALLLASQWLAAVSADMTALNRDCTITVELDNAYVHPPVGKFVPVYYVSWSEKSGGIAGVATVRLFAPTKTLLQLRVEDSKYILRPPIVFTNLAELLSQTNAPATNAQSNQ